MPAAEPILIIVADDNPGDRLLAAKALRKGGIDNPLLEVEDGRQLLDLLRSEAPRGRRVVVFLDISMPRMNGIEALTELRAAPALRCVPVVMLTTSEADIDLIRACELGANSYLSKPVSFAEFLPKMQQLGVYWTRLVTVPVLRGS